MDAIQRAVVAPQVEIVEKCAARRQVFRDRTPLASRAQNIHDPVHHFAHLDMALVAAAFGGRDQWFDIRPFIVGQVTRISQFAAVVTSAVLRRPHRGAPLESGHHFESQTIQRIQNVFGRTLRYTSSYLTLRHNRSTNTLSRQAPLPSMLMAIPFLINTPVNAAPVNWLP